MKRALEGILVLSLEQAVAAPYCSSRLADAGARVIKVERPEGDFARFYDQAAGDCSSYFAWLNRGKQSLVADLKKAEDVSLLHAILKRADVFIQNLAPQSAARAGFNSDGLRKRCPELITLDISGFGESGPYATMKAYDLVVQAESGLASITGHRAGPGRVGVSVCDIACGMSAHAAVLEALLERAQTGLGQSLKVSLFDSVADWMTVPLLQYEASGQAPARVGLTHPTICPYGVFSTREDALILIAIQNEREWAEFCRLLLEDPDLPLRKGYQSNVERTANREAVDARVALKFAELSRSEAIEKLRGAGIAYGFVNDLAAFARHPALRRVLVKTPSGAIRLAAPPTIRGDRPWTVGEAVPALGEHSEAIRAEFLV